MSTPETVFKVGRNNFALTIFMPVDCKNNCPFCTSKRNYAIFPPNEPAMSETIKALHSSEAFAFPDIVITGGEPFADVPLLKTIINFLGQTIEHNSLFINTTLPQCSMKEAIDLINSDDAISGVNISRHIGTFYYDAVAEKEALFKIKKPIHINCVLTGKEQEEDIFNHYLEYSPFGKVVFRADYTTVDHAGLHSMLDPTFKTLDKLFGYNYSTQCHVCHTDHFLKNVTYHRGVEHSSIQMSNYKEINDLVILQDGKLLWDWDISHSEFTPGVDYTIEYPANYGIKRFRGVKKHFQIDGLIASRQLNSSSVSSGRGPNRRSAILSNVATVPANTTSSSDDDDDSDALSAVFNTLKGVLSANYASGSCGSSSGGGFGGCGSSSIDDDGDDHFMGGC